MDERGFYNFCIAASVFMILINCCITLVAGLGVFTVKNVDQSIIYGNTTTPGSLSTNATGFDLVSILEDSNIWGVLLSGGAIGTFAAVAAAGYGFLRNNWTPLMAILFIEVFWGSYIINTAFFSYGGFINIPVIGFLFMIITLVMVIVFFGAFIGIFTNKGG